MQPKQSEKLIAMHYRAIGKVEACDNIQDALRDLVSEGYIPQIAIMKLFRCCLDVRHAARKEEDIFLSEYSNALRDESRPPTGKGVTNCDDCHYGGKCKAPITRDGITYHCIIDENTGEWIE
jgi:hypothetical protein